MEKDYGISLKSTIAMVELDGGKVEPYTIELAKKVRAGEITLEEAIKKIEDHFIKDMNK